MINLTKELRIKKGKFTALTIKQAGENNHAANCQACLSDKPDSLYPVMASDDKILWVGSTCKAILTDERLPSLNDGEIWTLTNKQNQTIEFIKPDKDFYIKAKEIRSQFARDGRNQNNDMYFRSVDNAIKSKRGITVQMYNNLLWLFVTVENWE